MTRRLLVLPIITLVLASIPVGGAQLPAAVPLFAPAGGPAADQARGIGRETRRSRVTRVRPEALTSGRLRLELFPGVTLEAEIIDRALGAPGWVSWSGRVSGDPLGSATFVAAGGVVQGAVRTGARAYSLEPMAGEGGLHVIREIDLAALGPELPPLAPPATLADADAAGDASPEGDDGSTIDVLVAYTAAARTAAGGTEAAIQARILLGVIETNQAYANSGIVQRLRLVGAELVGYHESGDIAFDLQQLTERDDGQMDGIHLRRDAAGADLVQLIVAPGAGTACGVAWQMQTPSAGFALLGFSVTAYDCISPNYTFGHELAHNMGSAHAPEDPNVSPSFIYSYGYKDPAAAFRTVMAYNCAAGCPRVLHFSNPAIHFGADPTGVTGLQDNALSLDTTRLVVANFRQSRDPATVLGPPRDFAVTTTGTSAVFSWSPPATGMASSYVVEAGLEDGFAGVASFIVAGSATTLVVPSVAPGTYFLRVRARNASGPGAPSASLSLTMTPTGRCIAPAGSPVLHAEVSGKQVLLSWSAPADGGPVESAVIGAGRSPGALDAAFIPTDSAATDRVVDASNGLYFVRVAGRNPCGIGAPSNEVAVTVGPAVPGPPSGFTATVQAGGVVTLTWNAPAAGAPPQGYVIEAGSASGLADIARLAGDGTATSLVIAAAPRTYFVRVRATAAAGVGAPSNEVVVVVT